jgi:predicted RNase H-like HicB family nuclease
MDHVKTFTITVTPTTGGYRARCLTMPDCAANGTSQEEALQRVEDLIKDRCREAVLRGEELPVDRTSVRFLWVDTDEFLV